MIWLYNIYHGSTVSDEKVVINSNDRALEKIRAWQKQAEDERLRQKKSAADEYLDTLQKDESGKPILEKNEDGSYKIPEWDDDEPLFSVDENGEPFFEEVKEEEEAEEEAPVQTEEEKQRILDAANEEAQSIMDKAKEEADALFLHTRDEAVQQGYTDGLNKAREENEQKQKALDSQADVLEENYRQKEASLEKEVLDAVLSVVQKAFLIEYSDDEDLLLRLVDNCINHAESAKELLIRANEKNYTLLTSKRDEIIDKVGEGVSVEFAKDPLLSDGQCMIETDGGVYDVSIDTELKNLIKRIRLLTL
ncbi:MAG: FliH/SctL family protein [Lachnospiraceae bacterium]|nr:FliH/SctL family protein [Lachnospiraceae bacterium]